jgi:hypothetical protein
MNSKHVAVHVHAFLCTLCKSQPCMETPPLYTPRLHGHSTESDPCPPSHSFATAEHYHTTTVIYSNNTASNEPAW